MKHRSDGSFFLSIAFISGLMAWLGPPAYAANAHGPTTIRCVNPGGTGGCLSAIQAAIDASAYGDRVDVAGGTYTEHVTMRNGVSVYGVGWDTTIINGNHSGPSPTVNFPSGIDATTVLSGVQVMGGGTGVVASSGNNGGGISILDSSPRVINTWANSNTANNGGGIYVSGGSPSFDNVPAWNNQAVLGGGFYLSVSSPVTLTGNPLASLTNGTVFLNSADRGGGIYISCNVTTTVSGLRIYGNTATNSGGGVWTGESSGSLLLFLNDISGNTANLGAGIYADQATNLQLIGNWIGNKVGGNIAASEGGGLHLSSSAGSVQSNYFLNNQANGSGGGGGGARFLGSLSGLVFSMNWFEGNQAPRNGGGILVDRTSGLVIDANTIVTNTASFGAAISFNSPVTITNNIIARNVVTVTGSGALELTGVSSRIVNNTIAHNNQIGILFTSAEGVLIANNIIHENGSYGISRVSTTLYTADYNDVFGNGYDGLPVGAHDLALYADFAGAGDQKAFYHILATSPVSRTGSMAHSPAKDIDAQSRLLLTSMGADHLPINIRQIFLPLIKR